MQYSIVNDNLTAEQLEAIDSLSSEMIDKRSLIDGHLIESIESNDTERWTKIWLVGCKSILMQQQISFGGNATINTKEMIKRFGEGVLEYIKKQTK